MSAKYKITAIPRIIRYTPNALKSCFLIYDTKNLIASIDITKDTTQPTNKMIISSVVKVRPSAKNLSSFMALAPNIAGIPKKKENSAATVREVPSSDAPKIVEPLLEVPGTNDKHCSQYLKI